MLTNSDMLKIFETTGAMLKGHFILTSGRHSDTYMQCAKLFVHPAQSKTLCAALIEKMKGVQADVIVSPAVGGILMGYQVAQLMDLPNIFFERQDGVMTLRRGFELKPGTKVIAVEDVVTTGGSVKEVAAACEAMGAEVVAIASVVDRSNGGVQFGKPYYSLLSMDVVSWEQAECPLCKAGKTPAVKPGSRSLK